MTSKIMAVARNNQFFKIFLHGVPRRNFRFDLRKKTVLLLAEICAHSKASNVQYTPKTVHIHLKNQVYNTNIFRKEYVLYTLLG